MRKSRGKMFPADLSFRLTNSDQLQRTNPWGRVIRTKPHPSRECGSSALPTFPGTPAYANTPFDLTDQILHGNPRGEGRVSRGPAMLANPTSGVRLPRSSPKYANMVRQSNQILQGGQIHKSIERQPFSGCITPRP